jgi:hypothetical protein
MPAIGGVVAGLTLSPWALAAAMLWTVVTATAILTLVTLEQSLWIAGVVSAVTAALLGAGYAWRARRRSFLDAGGGGGADDVERGGPARETATPAAARRRPVAAPPQPVLNAQLYL